MKPIFTLRLITVLLFASSSFAQNTWTKKNDFPGGARSCASAVTIGNKIYMGLGFAVGGSKKDWWEYDPSNDTWIKKADFPGTARGHAAELAINGKAYIGLGSGDCSTCDYADWYEYDPANNTWTKKTDFLGGKRYSPVSFTVNGRAFVGTGASLTGANSYKGDMYEYDPIQNTWTQRANIGGSPRYSAVYFVIGSKAYVCTGQDASQGGGSWNRKELFEYDPTNDTWVQKADFPGVARDFASGFAIGNYGYVGIGWGNESPYREDFYEYDPSNNTWTQRANFGVAGGARNAGYTACNGKGYFITFSSYYYDPNNTFQQHFYPNSTEVWEYAPPSVTTSINDPSSATRLHTYPNPSNGIVKLFLENNANDLSIQIVDITGKIVYTESTNNYTGTTCEVNLTEYQQGTYFMTVVSGTDKWVQKIVLTSNQ